MSLFSRFKRQPADDRTVLLRQLESLQLLRARLQYRKRWGVNKRGRSTRPPAGGLIPSRIIIDEVARSTSVRHHQCVRAHAAMQLRRNSLEIQNYS